MRGRPYIGGLTRSPVGVGGGDRPPLSPAGGATGPPGGPTGLSPLGWATGACRPLGGRQGPLMQIGTIASVAFFFICSSLLVRLLCNF